MPARDNQSTDTLAPGTTLGQYEIGRLLGRGGMGAVYEAVHRGLKKRVAIKVLSAALASEEAKQRFLREGEAASRIQHPNVVDVTDVGVEGEVSYLVMEFLEGEDLSTRLAREGALSPLQAADILLPVCAGLAVAHDEGVVHRDLKPENIFLVRQRQGGFEAKVLDFGISKLTGRNASAMTATIATFGTPYYMPPEQIRGAHQADQRSDVYALGVVLYECVTGRRPFDAESIYAMLHAIGAGEYPLPRKVRPDLPPAVEAVIVRAMRLNPTDRFPSVRHLASALLPFAGARARAVWADTFAGNDNNIVGASGDKAGSGSGTRILPPEYAGPPSKGTTLGSSTGQSLDLTRPVRSRTGHVLAGVAALAALAVGAMVLLRSPQHVVEAPAATVPVASVATTRVPPPRPSYRVEVEVEPAMATLEVDGVPTGSRVLRRDFPLDGQEHRLIGRATGYRDRVVTFADEPPDPHLKLEPVIPETGMPPKAPSVSTGASVRTHHRHKKAASPTVTHEKTQPKSLAPVID